MRLPISIAAVIALLTFSASAQAQVLVGQLAPGVNPPLTCEYLGSYDELMLSVSSGMSYVVPAAGVLTSWSTNAGPGAGQELVFKVFRPTATPLSYRTVAHDGPRALTPSVLNTFPISIPVLAGDEIGLYIRADLISPRTACVFTTGNTGDELGYQEANSSDGGPMDVEGSFTEHRLNVSASLLPPPTISAFAPASGTIKGGGQVAITGSNLAEIKSVSFGSVPAESYAVNSESQVTAIAPASMTLAAVPVTVTTIAGTATSASTFSYQGCKVPKLKGRSLKGAKKKLKAADCKLGKVKKLEGSSTQTSKVKSQSPKQGKVLAAGSKVTVTLG